MSKRARRIGERIFTFGIKKRRKTTITVTPISGTLPSPRRTVKEMVEEDTTDSVTLGQEGIGEESESAGSTISDSSSSSSSENTYSADLVEELDDKLREEVERDIPPSITDLSLAEKSDVSRVLMIWNPYAGNKRGRKVKRLAKRMLVKEGVSVKCIRLTRRGHAEEICETYDFDGADSSSDEESADWGGIDVLAAVGGDGTFHECVNGMMKRMEAGKRGVPLAMIAAGTGNSFMRELHVMNLSNSISHILRGVHYPIDTCKVSFGDGSYCYAFNSLHWGLASKVNVRAEKLRWMGSAIRYTTAAFLELIKGSTTKAKITVVNEEGETIEFDDEFCLAIANNIITAAKGMKMAPEAKLDDGLIDLLLVRSAATFDLVQIFRKLYDGTHTELPFVDYMKVKSFTIAPYAVVKKADQEPEEVQLEEIIDVDGELKGVTPFSVEVLPRSLRVIL